MTTDSEDRSMIAELEQIIQAEEAKPEAERDVDLIDDCIREIAELKGVKAEYTDEEINRITDNLVKAMEREKKRKRFIRLAAGIAAAFVIVTGVTACAVNPALINWIVKIVRMPFGSDIDHSDLTYTVQGTTTRYYNIEDLLQQNNLKVYYPTILPEGIRIIDVEIVENNSSKIIVFTFSDPNYQYTIQLDRHDFMKQEIIAHIEANSLIFNVYQKGGYLLSVCEIEGNLYTIQSKEMKDAILVVGGIKKINENS